MEPPVSTQSPRCSIKLPNISQKTPESRIDLTNVLSDLARFDKSINK